MPAAGHARITATPVPLEEATLLPRLSGVDGPSSPLVAAGSGEEEAAATATQSPARRPRRRMSCGARSSLSKGADGEEAAAAASVRLRRRVASSLSVGGRSSDAVVQTEGDCGMWCV